MRQHSENTGGDEEGTAENTLPALAISPIRGGVLAQLAWAVPLATLLWIAATFAMGWLP